MLAACRFGLLLGVASLVAVAPVEYAYQHNRHFRNFRVVEEGNLYRSGQLTPGALDQIVRERNIRTVVTLRTTRVEGRLPPDNWEEDYCRAHGLKHARIAPQLWVADEKGDIPADQAVLAFIKVMDRPEDRPVLVHCFAGIHRTGTMCAVYRMEYQHWSVDRAINEMEQIGFDPLDIHECMEGYLRSYVPRWQRNKGE